MSNREAVLAEAKAAREARKADREKEVSVIKIQALVRGFLKRIALEKTAKANVDSLANKNNDNTGSELQILRQYLSLFYSKRIPYGANSDTYILQIFHEELDLF